MKVSVIGAGYVGLVTATCLAEMGHEVICMDSDALRVELLRSGVVPIYEPGLDTMIQRNTQDQRLFFTTRLQDTLEAAEVLFIAVGTPPKEDGSADLAHVLAVARQVGQAMTKPLVIVNKSTVPVGTAERVEAVVSAALQERDRSALPFAVISNPEFLKEGAAIDDFMRPDRIVIGLPAGATGDLARTAMTRLYATLNRHHERTVWMDVRSAELTKYAANAMLATRISFMNEMANLADLVGADVDAIRRGIGSDSRIGPSFLYAGTGYGGSCFPKDTRALMQTAQLHGSQMHLVEATERVNQAQRQVLARRVMAHFGADLSGRRFALWGLAFKPQTDDMREAPSRLLIRQLLLRGAEIQAHDPVAMEAAQRVLVEDLADIDPGLSRVRFMADANAALEGADALLVVTEWKQFHNPDFELIRDTLRQPLILDGRNLYDPQQLQTLGLAYQGVGRRNALAEQAMAGAVGMESLARSATPARAMVHA
ncbi:UDP-glucose/GDP-mannose dehydrogenase family protein [Curvibacter fontanus]|jgi:UDPglucose 6-dehydrogenase